MSSMTTNMFAPRIWGFDLNSAEARVARQAGWSHADILWEALMNTANGAWNAGEQTRAKRLFRRARLLASLFFNRNDLRRITGGVNLHILNYGKGNDVRAKASFARAAMQWRDVVGDAVRNMEIAPRARSSLFHLRMEALHRDTYHDNLRLRIGRIAEETQESLEALAKGQRPAHRLYSRWLGERPSVYDDTRKVLGACLLIADIDQS